MSSLTFFLALCKKISNNTTHAENVFRYFFCTHDNYYDSFSDEVCLQFYRPLDKDYCPIEIIKGLTDKGQFQYLIKLMGPQEGTYLYATQFHSLR